jgi:pyrroline-5-carboxylate reductase
MGGALLARWNAQNICDELVIVDPASTTIKFFSDIPKGFKPQVIVFAVKPQVLADMADDYRAYKDALFLSVAAGKPIAFFEQHLGPEAKIVRSMPNTPAAVGKAVTVACANKNVSDTEKTQATKLLGAIGKVVWVEKESLLNPVTALSGSGPAYVFLLIETLTKAGIRIGLEPDMAEKLARQTIIGSAALAEADPSPAAQLRQNVTSPGGTTEAALKVLMAEPGLQDLFDRALEAAAKRAEELSN